jgi:hypothetical protein
VLDVPAAARRLLSPADPDWPRLRLVAQQGDVELAVERVGKRRAELKLRTGGSVVVDRDAGTAIYTTPRPLGPEELVHPFLAPPAAIIAYWEGRLAFHAGAFVLDGIVWALLGDRGVGKSSTLGWLAGAGVAIVADDLLVLDGGRALPGPRSVDLRADASEALAAGDALGTVGARDRWRIRVADVPPEALSLGGFVVLDWSEETTLTRLSGPQRFAALQAQVAVRLPPRDQTALLDVVGLPAWRFARSPGWNRVEADLGRLLDTLAG